MLQILIIIVGAASYFVGRLHSDWVYTLAGVDASSDPDRILGIMATMTLGASLLVFLIAAVAGVGHLLVSAQHPAAENHGEGE